MRFTLNDAKKFKQDSILREQKRKLDDVNDIENKHAKLIEEIEIQLKIAIDQRKKNFQWYDPTLDELRVTELALYFNHLGYQAWPIVKKHWFTRKIKNVYLSLHGWVGDDSEWD